MPLEGLEEEYELPNKEVISTAFLLVRISEYTVRLIQNAVEGNYRYYTWGYPLDSGDMTVGRDC
jgi:hypothetical protein